MSDSEHADALSATGFWGRTAAGCLVMARDTGRLLVPLRSEEVLEPGTWGTWGGAIDTDEEPSHAVLRELVEETGFDRDARVALHPLMVFESGSFRYHNFLAVVDKEFTPEHNWETADSMWVSIDAMPAPLHPGLQALLADAESMKAIRAAEFQRWFDGSVIAKDGVPQVVYHGSTAIKVIPGQVVEGDRAAAEYLRGVAAAQGIGEASSVPSIFERWLEMGMAAERGVTPELAAHVRAMYERSKPTITKPVEDLGFEVFEMPGGGKELGAHFGSTRTQAQGFGTVFEFYLSMRNPLRMPDLGTWGYQSVIREARKVGVDISEAEYDAIFNASDENSALREVLMRKGYDGVVYANEAEGRGDSYIAFDPGKIRRADPEVAELASQVRYSIAAEPPHRRQKLQDWFSDSKCVDRAGNPLVVYHGTPEKFRLSDFSIGRKSRNFGAFGEMEVQRLGGFFTPSRKMAKSFAGGDGGAVLKAHLCIKKPLNLREGYPQEVWDHLAGLLREFNLDVIGYQGMWELFDTGFPGAKEFVEAVKGLGFDGALLCESGPDQELYETWVVFDAGQVRAIPKSPVLEVREAATAESMKAAIFSVVRCPPEELQAGVGGIVVTTAAELTVARDAQQSEAALQEWFGDSRVTDHDGEPRVVYHGTGGDEFSSFRSSESGWYGRGIYFTDDVSVADEYSLNHDEAQRIMPVYLRMERPYYYREPGFYERRASDEANFDMIRDVLPKGRASRLIARMRREDTGYLQDEFFLELQKMGHDGIIVESSTSKGCEYIVFYPEQIKSALGNRGTYDPSNPDIRHSLAAGAAGLDPSAQAFHDVATNTTVFLADRIPAGREASVFLHETVHRHGRQALPEGRWGALVGQVKAWAQAEPQSPERAIHDAAAARVATAGVAGVLADEELFAYAVEEAVAMGIEPTAAAVQGSAEAWLQVVVESIQRVTDKLLGNDLQDLSGQDLVDLAYALAQLDSPEHGVEVRRALTTGFEVANHSTPDCDREARDRSPCHELGM